MKNAIENMHVCHSPYKKMHCAVYDKNAMFFPLEPLQCYTLGL